MKINTISNTNFHGLFVDRTSENGGNWRMEYYPYSWENKMAPKVHLDIFASKLPMNEEIYEHSNKIEQSKDILGTISYYKDVSFGRDILRKTITQMPAMNLEDSLKTKEKKLVAFIKQKENYMQSLKAPLQGRMQSIFNISKLHYQYASDINRDIFSHQYTKEARATGVKNNFDKMTKIAEENGTDFQKYIRLSESANDVRNELNLVSKQISELEVAKFSNKLIDISRRDINACDEPLAKALQDVEKAKGKLVALSNGTITVDEILKAIGKDFKIHKAIEYVEKLMMKKI